MIWRRAFRPPERRASMRLLVIVALALSGLPAAAQDAARDALVACVAYFDEDDRHEDDVPWSDIDEACPDLQSALESSEYAPWLPEAWRDHASLVTLDSLVELERLLEAESTRREADTLDTASLSAVLQNLDRVEDSHRITWWDRFVDWLRERTLRRQGAGDASWLADWLNELGEHETFLRVLGYSLLGAIVLVALGIVVNEMKVAGVFGRSARRTEQVLQGAAVSPAAPSDGPTDRLASLIDRILAVLAQEHRGVLDVGATHRELVRDVRLPRDDERATFVRLIDCAERVRYAAAWPPTPEIDGALDGGARLLAALKGRASAPEPR